MLIKLINDNKTNNCEFLTSDILGMEYNFVKGEVEGTLISEEEIDAIYSKNFWGIEAEKINAIFELAESPVGKLSFNFTFYEDGRIEIGYRIKHIKSYLEEYKEAYKKFKERKNYNRIIIEL